MIFHKFVVYSWHFSCRKQALCCQIIVSIPDSLLAGALICIKFRANSLHSADVSQIAYTCYNLENLTCSHIWDFNPNFLFSEKQCCLITIRPVHEVNVPVTAAWSQFHASLVRQWSCLLVWGMGPLSLPAECSLFTSLHNFGKNSRTNTVEVLILNTFL